MSLEIILNIQVIAMLRVTDSDGGFTNKSEYKV